MLDGVGLIHMNGRVYDPAVGRFLSVDPLVREAAASQSWNGYGYVEGRVLSAIDPNGYSLMGISVQGFIRRIEGRANGSTSSGGSGAGAAGGAATEGTEPQGEQRDKNLPPCSSMRGASIDFTSQIGAYGSAGARFSLLGLRIALDGELNLFSYNTPLSGSPYWSRGVEAALQIGAARAGISWEQRSYDGGMSFWSEPTNFVLGDLKGSSEGMDFDLTIPQVGAGFRAGISNVDALLPPGDTPLCRP